MDRDKIKLGLRRSAGANYLFIGDNDGDHGWYKYDFNADKQIPVNAGCLVGIITKLHVFTKPAKKGTSTKLDIFVSADEEYVIRAGVTTNFIRGFLLALNTLQDLNTIVKIIPKQGDQNSKVVFCTLVNAETNKVISYGEWDENVKLFPIIQAIQKRLGQEPQGKEALTVQPPK